MRGASSLDHLVGAGKERRWHFEAERARGLRIDDELELRRLHDRQVGGRGALEQPCDVDADLAPGIGRVAEVIGSAWRDARLANCTRRLVKNGSAPTNSASGHSCAKAAKAASISPAVLARATWVSSRRRGRPPPRRAMSTRSWWRRRD